MWFRLYVILSHPRITWDQNDWKTHPQAIKIMRNRVSGNFIALYNKVFGAIDACNYPTSIPWKYVTSKYKTPC